MSLPGLLFGRVIRHHHVRGAVVGIGLSLIPLVVIIIVADGMIEGITSRYIELKTYHLRVYAQQPEEDSARLAELLRGVEGVNGVYRELEGEGLLKSDTGLLGVVLRCIDPELVTEDPGFVSYLSIVAGERDLSAPGSILLGEETARRLGAGVGDSLRLATLAATAQLALPRLSTVRVSGVFRTGYQELDKNWVFLSVNAGRALLSARGREDFLGLKIQDPFASRDALIARLRAVLPRTARVYDWYQLEMNQFRSFDVTRNLLLFVMALIVVVGCVNVSSAVYMIVLERLPEIGILKSMGASGGAVRRWFLLVGVFCGGVGATLGLCLGLLVGVHINEVFRAVEGVVNGLWAAAAAIQPAAGAPGGQGGFRILDSAYYLERIPIRVHFVQLAVCAWGTMGLATLAAYMPARRAAAVRPLEVIRKH